MSNVYTQYRPVRQTKMSTNVHYVPICQTYYLPNIPRSCMVASYIKIDRSDLVYSENVNHFLTFNE